MPRYNVWLGEAAGKRVEAVLAREVASGADRVTRSSALGSMIRLGLWWDEWQQNNPGAELYVSKGPNTPPQQVRAMRSALTGELLVSIVGESFARS